MTLSPVMGDYLDMANNDKPAAGANPNENYARELLQLFTIGLWELDLDGTPLLDAQGKPIPTYDQRPSRASRTSSPAGRTRCCRGPRRRRTTRGTTSAT